MYGIAAKKQIKSKLPYYWSKNNIIIRWLMESWKKLHKIVGG